MHWLDPHRWDLGQKIGAAVGTILSGIVSSFGIHAAVRNWRLEREAAEHKRISAIVTEALQATQDQLREAYIQGAKHEQDNILAIASEVQGLNLGVKSVTDWTGTHQNSDDTQFQELKAEQIKLREGQAHTHRELDEMRKLAGAMNEMLIRADEGIRWLKREREQK